MTTVSDPWIIDTTPALFAAWLERWRLDAPTSGFDYLPAAIDGELWRAVSPSHIRYTESELDTAGNLLMRGWGHGPLLAALPRALPEHFGAFVLRAIALDTTRAELSITVHDSRIEPWVDALRAAIAQRWPPADVAKAPPRESTKPRGGKKPAYLAQCRACNAGECSFIQLITDAVAAYKRDHRGASPGVETICRETTAPSREKFWVQRRQHEIPDWKAFVARVP